MNDPHHDHSSYSLSTEHMPARFTCILSTDPHNDLLRWAIFFFFTLIDEETQTVTCPGSQREEPAISSEPSDLSFGFSPCGTDVTRAAPQKNRASTSAGLVQGLPRHNPSRHLQAILHTKARATLSNSKSDHPTLFEISSGDCHWPSTHFWGPPREGDRFL